jgi:hypothetical protein
MAFARAAEGRLGTIPDVEGNRGYLGGIATEHPARELDAPSREIAHRRLPDALAEARTGRKPEA